ncbi:Transcription factor ILR3 [Capsicum baccatum]|uniref:Transcription factor ILR3 n=1 Tax=Capsicum baccatum TaxID=33114 RepID=A0A2G2VR23_CAPBA|nr:Transcription factor ILR3 [Capsicum baccatum]
MITPENIDWLYDYNFYAISIPDANFSFSASGFSWSMQGFNGSTNASVDIDGSIGESDCLKESGSKKRARAESCTSSSSKACRERLRREKLNDKFMELAALLEPGRPPKTDKSAILIDAVRVVEKHELRDEKQRLKSEKEKLEQQLKTMSAQPGFLPPAMPGAFAAPVQATVSKLVPIVSYPGMAMWQFMPPAAIDTSQDHVLRPPVA